MSYWPFLSDPGPIIVHPCQPLNYDLVEIKFGLPLLGDKMGTIALPLQQNDENNSETEIKQQK